MNNLEEEIRAVIAGELGNALDIDSFLKNTQEVLRHLPKKLAKVIAKECFSKETRASGCFYCRSTKNIFDDLDGDLIDLNS